jgi:hypothetical protein
LCVVRSKSVASSGIWDFQVPDSRNWNSYQLQMMMEAETVFETLDYNAVLARLIARGDFITFEDDRLASGMLRRGGGGCLGGG